LDPTYFYLYDIAREDVDYIMDTFRVWREKEEKQRGEFRTRRVILEIYDEMQRAMESGQAYRTRVTPGPADPAVAHAADARTYSGEARAGTSPTRTIVPAEEIPALHKK